MTKKLCNCGKLPGFHEPVLHRLEYLRAEILAERISYLELTELQSLAEYIEPGDTLLLEWAGVPEGTK